MPGISAALKLARRGVCVWESLRPDRWPQLPLPERHNEHQILIPKVGANQAVLPPAE